MLWNRKDHGSEDQNPEGAQNPVGNWVPLEVTVRGGAGGGANRGWEHASAHAWRNDHCYKYWCWPRLLTLWAFPGVDREGGE